MPIKTKIVQVLKPRRRRSRRRARTVKTTIVKSRRRNRRRLRKSSSLNLSSQVLSVMDPCSGPLLPTIGSGSITQRVRSSLSGNLSGTASCGYVVWFPSYHNIGASGNASNLFYWESVTSATVPSNTAANPLGMGALLTTGSSQPDPASGLLAGNVYGRAQAMSACLQFEYTGALSLVAGQVAIIKNLPLKAMFTNNTSIVLNPPSVDTLFSYASDRERLQITGHEVIWRPTDNSAIYRTGGNERPGGALVPDTAWVNGVPASTSSTLSGIDTDNVYGIAIAWKGLPVTNGITNINFVKVVGLELAASGGSGIEPTFTTPQSNTFSPYSTVTAWLDKNVPSWQSRAVNMSLNAAGQFANILAPKLTSGLRGNSRLLTNY